MKILFIIITVLAVAATLIYTAESEWTKSLDVALTLSQSKSKVGAEDPQSENSSLSYGLLVNGELTKDNPRANWKNTLKLEYARSKNKVAGVGGDWSEDIDKLTIDSMYRWKFYPKFNPYAALNTQNAILDSNFAGELKAFRPIQLRESAGVSSPIIEKPNENLVARAGIYHEHLINDPAKQDNVTGIELVFDYKNQFKDDMLFLSKLGFYSGLTKVANSWELEKSTNIKMEWDNTLLVKLSKYINMNLSLNILNRDISNSDVEYEWDQKLNLAFNYKVF
jgi:hypothetical protein